MRRLSWLILLTVGSCIVEGRPIQAAPQLRVGFAEVDVTPKIGKKPIYIAGFGQNRIATGVLDPIMARVVVLHDGTQTIGVASVDVVGISYPMVQSIRKKLPEFATIMVGATHNHNGPDTVGIWGPNPYTSGVDPEYNAMIESKVVDALKQAAGNLRPVEASIGSATAPELLTDTRPPFIKHDELVAIRFEGDNGKTAGIIVQWNCHPETIDSKSTLLTADYVATTVKQLQDRHKCPVVYLTGTVGGLMTSMRVKITDAAGQPLKEGSEAKMVRYGELLADVANKALQTAKPARLTPFDIRQQTLFVPVENKLFLLAWQLGVMKRNNYAYSGDPYAKELPKGTDLSKPVCIQTEVSFWRLGDLDVALIPGEIYPELVIDQVPDPVPPGADFPDAKREPAIYPQMTGKFRMIIGLANDEVGYILSRRQWDVEKPFTFGLPKAPYGEVNSLGPQTAPILTEAFRRLAQSPDSATGK
ncbi:hypothetical protein [Tuwongella immobilis]|uniref:Neutral/alkaline non-lysosomal ceramidase N-terminal domain-containing protein n=1 Tax=Tuwongella immobilis TaxID=692036 RepID=A0A6C2YY32_9BACT|nr:hypothetical protein [Tuwongella immobilis]VIP05655.1 Uncharacterized protein OS=Pirellula staleyi (strain ATCC 27377 / DSM 6068 / ICPB 4128) GN=Psta_1770 PE=4 SV=1 [Tuwongella immobilis]VTS08666.1 Uncharacterized protein OS=Pirellula staleyi (strain ATCC 27377 / DSM 6068 / ICPB 4128) GN=Psta_1770 PE=4 SV=1 [Tuwongella immobilis]